MADDDKEQDRRPRVLDPNNVPVTFVNAVEVQGFLNGVVNLTLTTARFTALRNATVAQDEIVSARLRFDLLVAQQLRDALDEIIQKNTKPAVSH